MTANVAQVFLTDSEWASVLRAGWNALRPGGHLVFETRNPERQAWREWTRERSQRQTAVPEVGVVEILGRSHRTERPEGQLSLDFHLPGRRGHHDIGYDAAVSRPCGDREIPYSRRVSTGWRSVTQPIGRVANSSFSPAGQVRMDRHER